MSLFDSSVPSDGEAVKNGASRIREVKGILQTILSILFNDDYTFKTNVVPGTALEDGTVNYAKLNADVLPPLAVPTGVWLPYGGDTAPTNYLMCYGQQVSRTTYANLFAVIGVKFGNGDGSTTFNLPDLRGRVTVGLDNMGGTPANRITAANAAGTSGGSSTHTLTPAEQGNVAFFASIEGKNSGGDFCMTGLTINGVTVNHASPGTSTVNLNASAAPHDNTQPWLGGNYIIRI